jgi:hypothetical protein
MPPEIHEVIFRQLEEQQRTAVELAEFRRKSERLGKLTKELECRSRLLQENSRPSEYLPRDLAELLRMQQTINEQLSNSSNREFLRRALVKDIRSFTISQRWTRCVRQDFARGDLIPPDCLNGPSRFGTGDFSTFYLAEDITTAAFEISCLYDSLEGTGFELDPDWISLEMKKRFALRIRVDLERIVDLRDPETLDRLSISTPELRKPLIGVGPHLTREIGIALHHAQFEGLIAPSANSIGKADLVVFPDNVRHLRERLIVEEAEPLEKGQ